MTCQNAYQGVKKIFTAEVLGLIGTLCMVIVVVFGVVALVGVDAASDGATIAGGIGAVIFFLGGGIVSIVGLILLMIGTKRASEDEPVFNTAFMYILCSLILTVASVILNMIWPLANWDNLSTTVANVFSMTATIYIIMAVQRLANRLEKPEMVSKGNTYMTLLIIAYAIQIILRVVPVFYGPEAATSTVVSILTLAAEIFTLVAYILYLIYLGQAKKMLQEN